MYISGSKSEDYIKRSLEPPKIEAIRSRTPKSNTQYSLFFSILNKSRNPTDSLQSTNPRLRRNLRVYLFQYRHVQPMSVATVALDELEMSI